MAMNPPQSTLTGYSIAPYTVSTSIDSLLAQIEFVFERKMLWTTLANTFADQGAETQPMQVEEAYEFALHRLYGSFDEIEVIQAFLDGHSGSAVPFHFTAPDDGTVYAVQFKEDKIAHQTPNGDTVSYSFSLVTAGDVDGTLDNTAVYPSYITVSSGPGTNTSGGGGTTAPEPATGTVRTDLIAEYLMVGGSGATITDTSGNGNTATLGLGGSAIMQAEQTDAAEYQNSYAYTSPTWLDTGLSFNGSSIITLADGSIVNSSTPTTFSAELWIYPLSQGDGDAVYFNFGWSDHFMQDRFNATYWWPLYYDRDSTGNTTVDVLDPVTYQGFSWGTGPYQVVITRDPTGAGGGKGNLATYVNGVISDSTVLSRFPGVWDTPNFTFDASTHGVKYADVRLIGNDMFPPGGIHAVIGEIRFYGRALTDAEVLQNFNARKSFYGLP